MHVVRAWILMDGDAVSLDDLASARAVALMLGLDLASAKTVVVAVWLRLSLVGMSWCIRCVVVLVNR